MAGGPSTLYRIPDWTGVASILQRGFPLRLLRKDLENTVLRICEDSCFLSKVLYAGPAMRPVPWPAAVEFVLWYFWGTGNWSRAVKRSILGANTPHEQCEWVGNPQHHLPAPPPSPVHSGQR